MGKRAEKVITGTSWVTLGRVQVKYFEDKPTKIAFLEEEVSVVDGVMSQKNVREFSALLKEPTTTFPLVDPKDNLPTGGDMNYRQLERALYSLYYAKVQELDALGMSPTDTPIDPV